MKSRKESIFSKKDLFKKWFDDSIRYKSYREMHVSMRKPARIMLGVIQVVLGSTILATVKTITIIPTIIMMIHASLSALFYRKDSKLITVITTFILGLTFYWIMYVRTLDIYTANPYTIYMRGINLGLFETSILFSLFDKKMIIVFEILIIIAKFLTLHSANLDVILLHILNDFLALLIKLILDRKEKQHFYINYDKTKSFESFKTILDKILPCSVSILNPQSEKVLFSNQTLYSTFSIKDDQGTYKIFQELKIENGKWANENEDISVFEYMRSLPEKDFSPVKKLCYYKEEGNLRRFEITVFSLDWNGNSAIGIVLNDLTHQIEILNLKKSNENKEMAISVVAHELRNPLNGLLGGLETLKLQSIEKGVNKSLDVMKTNIQYMLHLLNSILDLQQIKANKLSINPTQFKIRSLFHSIELLFEFQCNLKGINFKTSIEPFVPEIIYTDHERLMQILINLCANAIKFTTKGSITMKAKMESDSIIRFEVIDTGVGMEKEEKNELFKAFGRLKSNSFMNKSGVGLGLMISNSLIKILNSDNKSQIYVESEFNHGSNFYFFLPIRYFSGETDNSSLSIKDESIFVKLSNYESILHPSPNFTSRSLYDENKAILSARILSSSSEETEKAILIVDDNPFNIYNLKEILKRKGYTIYESYNGKEAIAEVEKICARGIRLSLIFMDCEMPIMDGLEATKILVSMMEQNLIPKVPIVGCSGNISEEFIKECKESGMIEYLKKPVRQEEILNCVRHNSL